MELNDKLINQIDDLIHDIALPLIDIGMAALYGSN